MAEIKEFDEFIQQRKRRLAVKSCSKEASRKCARGFYIYSFLPAFTFLLIFSLDEILDHAGEFHREDELGGRALADVLEGLEVLQGHGLLVNGFGAFNIAKPSFSNSVPAYRFRLARSDIFLPGTSWRRFQAFQHY